MNLSLFLLSFAAVTTAKILTQTELATVLRKNGVPDYQIPTWTCLAELSSRMNTSKKHRGRYGIFQIDEQTWCSPGGDECHLPCTDFIDDDVDDDVKCALKIYDEYRQEHPSGFMAWGVYESCKLRSSLTPTWCQDPVVLVVCGLLTFLTFRYYNRFVTMSFV